ncbi:hypothetical protein VNO78_25829 [Psophocarpus tetragonolobus]|uniref:Uncharacterized protein n=1 Tax=Psophocarpus tetragonolobus TaxID=3891 RepID=A0AAN9S8G8_PSOTE
MSVKDKVLIEMHLTNLEHIPQSEVEARYYLEFEDYGTKSVRASNKNHVINLQLMLIAAYSQEMARTVVGEHKNCRQKEQQSGGSNVLQQEGTTPLNNLFDPPCTTAIEHSLVGRRNHHRIKIVLNLYNWRKHRRTIRRSSKGSYRE